MYLIASGLIRIQIKVNQSADQFSCLGLREEVYYCTSSLNQVA